MKKLDISAISSTVGLPAKSGTLAHIQSAYQEAIAQSIITGIVSYDTSKAYILTGLVNSGTNPAYNITAGAIFYNGEVFLVDAASGTLTGSNVVTGVIATTFFVASDADPVMFTDGVTRNVHQIRKVILQPGLSGSGIADYTNFRAVNPANGPGIGEMKMYVGSTSDFDGTGLGIASGVRGWAIANGNNGTYNMKGKVPIGYNASDSDFNTIGNPGGSKSHTNTIDEMAPHSHILSLIDGDDTLGGINYIVTAGTPSTGGSLTPFATISSTGSGTAYSIMNPYLVVLFIQRIY